MSRQESNDVGGNINQAKDLRHFICNDHWSLEPKTPQFALHLRWIRVFRTAEYHSGDVASLIQLTCVR